MKFKKRVIIGRLIGYDADVLVQKLVEQAVKNGTEDEMKYIATALSAELVLAKPGRTPLKQLRK